MTNIAMWQYFYFAVVVLLFYTCVLLSLTNKKTSLLVGAALLIPVVIIFNLRDVTIGRDTQNYYDFFSGRSIDIAEPFFNFLKEFELGPFASLALINYFSALSILIFFYKLSPRPMIAFACYLTTFLFLNTQINIVRQGFAIGLNCLAISMYDKKQYFWMTIFLILATTTHYSALIVAVFLLTMLLINRMLLNVTGLLIIGAAVLYTVDVEKFILALIEGNDFFSRVKWYLTWSEGREWQVKHVFYFAIPFTLVCSMKWKQILNNDVSLLAILSIFCVAMLFRRDEMFADRLIYYAIPFFIVIWDKFFFALLPKTRWPIVIFASIWLIKTALFQLPTWFLLYE